MVRQTPENPQTQTQINQKPEISISIKTYIEHPEEISSNNIIYVRALLREIRKEVEQSLPNIEDVLMKYYDKDICELPQHMPMIIRSHVVHLTANSNIRAEIYYDSNLDLDYDLIIDKKYAEIRDTKDNILERGEIYVAISGWNRICGDWTVKDLLEENEYQPEISIIYIPKNEDEYDP